MDPRVSVIIPTKNRARYVSSAIQSVLDQTFGDFEIIIVDAASTDNTKEIVCKFDDERIHYIREERDRGVSASRNMGIKQSRGKFIAFLDDDDLWVSSKLEKQLNLLNENTLLGAVSTGALIINNNDKIIGFVMPSIRGYIFPEILKMNYVGNCSIVLVRKEALEKVGLFDENLNANEDFDLWIRLARHYQFDCVKEYLVLYRVHGKRISTNLCRILRAKKLLYKKYSKELMKFHNRKRILGFWHYSLGVLYCECGDMRQGKKEFLNAVMNDLIPIPYHIRLFASFFGSNVFRLSTRLVDSFAPKSLRNKYRTDLRI